MRALCGPSGKVRSEKPPNGVSGTTHQECAREDTGWKSLRQAMLGVCRGAASDDERLPSALLSYR